MKCFLLFSVQFLFFVFVNGCKSKIQTVPYADISKLTFVKQDSFPKSIMNSGLEGNYHQLTYRGNDRELHLMKGGNLAFDDCDLSYQCNTFSGKWSVKNDSLIVLLFAYSPHSPSLPDANGNTLIKFAIDKDDNLYSESFGEEFLSQKTMLKLGHF